MDKSQDTSTPSLLSRFEQFMAQYPGAESIDRLVPSGAGQKGKRADYLLAQRTIILELKTLTTDIRPKIDRFTDELSERDDWPVFYGSVELSQIAKHLPDGAEIQSDMYQQMSRSIEKAFKKAHRQIGETRTLFGLPDQTPGLLVMLNESVEDLGPDIVGHRVSELLADRRADNSLRYDNIATVLLIAESHVLHADSVVRPLILIDGPGASQLSHLRLATDEMVRRWAGFNGATALAEQEIKQLDEVTFQSKTQWDRDHTTTPKRHELWRREYRQDPYLRNLDDDDVFEHGRRLFRRMAPYFLKGRPNLPDDVLNDLMIGWTHFLEEAAFRGLDYRDFKASVD